MFLIIYVDVKIDAGLEIPSLKMYWSIPTTHKWEKEKLPYSAINKSIAVLQLPVGGVTADIAE